MIQGKVVVDAQSLFRVLNALNGEPHLIRELQAKRNHPDNPINRLVHEWNLAAEQNNAMVRKPQ